MCDVENLCKTAGNYFKYVTDLDSSKDMFYIIGQLVNIQKMSLLKGEVRVRFIKDVLVPMCKAISSLPLEARKTYIDKTLYCWREVCYFFSYLPFFIGAVYRIPNVGIFISNNV